MSLLPTLTEVLSRRIIDITYQEKLHHLSSTLSSLPIILDIYQKKKDDEVFILSNSHARLAEYVVQEYVNETDAVELLHKNGIKRTGPGVGLSIAVGHALANPNKKVYCLISDGECANGLVWESLRLINEQKLTNLEVYVNINKQGGYDEININSLVSQLVVFLPTLIIKMSSPLQWPFAKGVQTHHHVLSAEDYEMFNNKDKHEHRI